MTAPSDNTRQHTTPRAGTNTILKLLAICTIFLFADHALGQVIQDQFAYLPLISRPYPPPPTATATRTPVPPTPEPPQDYGVIIDGGFEQHTGDWIEVSTEVENPSLIRHRDNLPVPPHAGNWSAWLGRHNNDTNTVAQVVTIPTSNPELSYWIWIDSEDTCDDDVGGVALIYADESIEPVDGYWLCSDNNTNGWVSRTVGMSTFAGDTAILTILAGNNEIVPSHLFVDDVALRGDATQTTLRVADAYCYADGCTQLHAALTSKIHSLRHESNHVGRPTRQLRGE